MAAEILHEATNFIGTRQYSSGHKKIVDAYNSITPLPVGYRISYNDDWCDVFVTVIADRLGLSHLIGRECGVQRHVILFQKMEIWLGKSIPKPGDLIVFDWDKGGFADHIGFVEKVDSTFVHTIEGNTNKIVARRRHRLDSNYIMGVARPKYQVFLKSTEKVAEEVLMRKWGNGAERKRRLENAGYNYQKVQTEVTRLINFRTDLNALARAIISGRFGNGNSRVQRLKNIGLDASRAQKRVNELI